MDSNPFTTPRSSPPVATDVATTPDLPPFDPYKAPEQLLPWTAKNLPTTTPREGEHPPAPEVNPLHVLSEVAIRLERYHLKYWTTMSTYRLLDTHLPYESLANTCSSLTPEQTGAVWATLSTTYDELNLNSDLDMNGMLMEECITTLSAVRWVENESTPCPPGFLTYNATIASFTRISKSYTALRKELGTTSERRGMSVLRISEGRIAKWAPGPGSRRMRGLHASMH